MKKKREEETRGQKEAIRWLRVCERLRLVQPAGAPGSCVVGHWQEATEGASRRQVALHRFSKCRPWPIRRHRFFSEATTTTSAASATVNDILIIFVSPVNVSFSSIVTRKRNRYKLSLAFQTASESYIPILSEKPRPVAGASHTHPVTLLHNGLVTLQSKLVLSELHLWWILSIFWGHHHLPFEKVYCFN